MRLFVTAVLLATAAAPALADTRGFPVGGFDRVRTTGPFDVRIHTGRRPAVRADGPREMLDRLRVGVRGGELVIEVEQRGWRRIFDGNGRPTVIDVDVPQLAAVAATGPGDVAVDRVRGASFTISRTGPGDVRIGELDTQQLSVRAQGPGDFTANGRAVRATISRAGPGDIAAAGLTVNDLTLDAAGPGDVTVRALRTASGRSTGPGDIRIIGPARCTIRKSGPGDLKCG